MQTAAIRSIGHFHVVLIHAPLQHFFNRGRFCVHLMGHKVLRNGVTRLFQHLQRPRNEHEHLAGSRLALLLLTRLLRLFRTELKNVRAGNQQCALALKHLHAHRARVVVLGVLGNEITTHRIVVSGQTVSRSIVNGHAHNRHDRTSVITERRSTAQRPTGHIVQRAIRPALVHVVQHNHRAPGMLGNLGQDSHVLSHVGHIVLGQLVRVHGRVQTQQLYPPALHVPDQPFNPARPLRRAVPVQLRGQQPRSGVIVSRVHPQVAPDRRVHVIQHVERAVIGLTQFLGQRVDALVQLLLIVFVAHVQRAQHTFRLKARPCLAHGGIRQHVQHHHGLAHAARPRQHGDLANWRELLDCPLTGHGLSVQQRGDVRQPVELVRVIHHTGFGLLVIREVSLGPQEAHQRIDRQVGLAVLVGRSVKALDCGLGVAIEVRFVVDRLSLVDNVMLVRERTSDEVHAGMTFVGLEIKPSRFNGLKDKVRALIGNIGGCLLGFIRALDVVWNISGLLLGDTAPRFALDKLLIKRHALELGGQEHGLRQHIRLRGAPLGQSELLRSRQSRSLEGFTEVIVLAALDGLSERQDNAVSGTIRCVGD